ncbi:hypothetical protein ACFQ08_19650 [Streptosporangium algeriense]|uniref:DUF7426 domain-containing protein n=1 Tax=Streptosporangium algeriense TaxID=1682748 RepID=A0ABW3DSE5_9ACTN
MPRFPELDASLGETLDLPLRLPSGQMKTYVVQPVDAESWTWLTARFTGLSEKVATAKDDGEEAVDDRGEAALYRRCLGPVYDELLADRAGWRQIRACGLTALAWHVHGEEAAQEVWERGGLPKSKSTSEMSDETGTPAEDPSTPSPASESGTTPNRKGRASVGTTSSPAGP